MNSFIFLIVSSVLLIKTYPVNLLVNTQILGNPNKENVILKIEVKNISNKTIRTVKDRSVDYKWDNRGIISLGNYIIEIEKNENGKFVLFGPSADIDPVFMEQEYIELQNNQSICDTLKIRGYLFSRNNERSFPIGVYRLRVHFKTDMMAQQIMGYSNWIGFKFE